MRKLLSITPVGERGISINNTLYLRSFECQIDGNCIRLYSTSDEGGQYDGYEGNLKDVLINGLTYPNDPYGALEALDTFLNFNSGGGTLTPTLQKVTEKGNTTTLTISFAEGQNDNEGVTLG